MWNEPRRPAASWFEQFAGAYPTASRPPAPEGKVSSQLGLDRNQIKRKAAGRRFAAMVEIIRRETAPDRNQIRLHAQLPVIRHWA